MTVWEDNVIGIYHVNTKAASDLDLERPWCQSGVGRHEVDVEVSGAGNAWLSTDVDECVVVTKCKISCKKACPQIPQITAIFVLSVDKVTSSHRYHRKTSALFYCDISNGANCWSRVNCESWSGNWNVDYCNLLHISHSCPSRPSLWITLGCDIWCYGSHWNWHRPGQYRISSKRHSSNCKTISLRIL